MFDFDVHEVDDQLYGTNNTDTGKWSGVIGELLNGVCRCLEFVPILSTFTNYPGG
jgi:hypothetical protein